MPDQVFCRITRDSGNFMCFYVFSHQESDITRCLENLKGHPSAKSGQFCPCAAASHSRLVAGSSSDLSSLCQRGSFRDGVWAGWDGCIGQCFPANHIMWKNFSFQQCSFEMKPFFAYARSYTSYFRLGMT